MKRGRRRPPSPAPTRTSRRKTPSRRPPPPRTPTPGALAASQEDSFGDTPIPFNIVRPGPVDPTELATRILFTIDTERAVNLDDAVHFHRISADVVEFGVHCTDFHELIDVSSSRFNELWTRQSSKYNDPLFDPEFNRTHTLTANCHRTVFSVVFTFNTATRAVLAVRLGSSEQFIASSITFLQAEVLLDGNFPTTRRLVAGAGSIAQDLMDNDVEINDVRTPRLARGTSPTRG